MYRKIEGWPRHSQNSVWNLMHESESGALCSPIVGGQHFKPPKGGWYQDVSPSLQIFNGEIFLFSQQIWNLPMKFGVPLDDLMLEFSISLHVDVRNRFHPSNYRVTQAAYRWFLASQLMEKRQHLGKKRMCKWFDSDLWKIRILMHSLNYHFLLVVQNPKKAKRPLRLNCTSHTWDLWNLRFIMVTRSRTPRKLLLLEKCCLSHVYIEFILRMVEIPISSQPEKPVCYQILPVFRSHSEYPSVWYPCSCTWIHWKTTITHNLERSPSAPLACFQGPWTMLQL